MLKTTAESVVLTNVVPVPPINPRLTTLGPSAASQPGLAIQMTQVSINLPLQTELGLQIVSQLTQQVGLPVSSGPSHAALMQEA
jgi:hypothetical protein